MGGGTYKQRMIYIVDDDESVCYALKILLMTFGFEVTTFNSAKSFFAAPPPDESGCLVLDINMPEVDGWAVLKRVLSSGSKLPIIFISADKHDNIADRVLKEGAVGFLQKPFDSQTLVDLINIASESNDGINKIVK